MATSTTSLGGDNELTGTDGADKLIAGGGSDTVDGGDGSDFINAGGGNDTLIYDENDYKILGGGGIDTLWFKAGGQQLRLESSALSGIEKLWLDGIGGNQVWLSAADVVRVSDNDQMIITGEGGNVVWLTDTGWSFAGLTSDGQSQILRNGLATMIVSLPIYVDGFSNNASITVSANLNLVEDSMTPLLTSTGTITISDPNARQALLMYGDTTYDTGLGTMAISLNQSLSSSELGVYDFTYSVSNERMQQLGEGKSLNDGFTLITIDGMSTIVNITITGVNDPASIGDPDHALVTEDVGVNSDGNLTVSGNVSISDIDDGEAEFKTIVTADAGNLGTLTFASNGQYTYSVANGSVQYLNSGESKEEIFTIKSVDGTSQNIIFTINGADDEILGTNENDTDLVGTPGDDVLRGLEGNDTIKGLEGNDYLYGDSGNDDLRGGDGNDHLYGDTGNDALNGGNGDDYLDGGDGSDIFNGSAGNDTLVGGASADHFMIDPSLEGTTSITGGLGVDTLYLFNSGTKNLITFTDFDTNSLAFGGDYLDLRALNAGNISSLSLVQATTQDNLYELIFNNGSVEYTVLSLVGTNLTIDQLADNILI